MTEEAKKPGAEIVPINHVQIIRHEGEVRALKTTIILDIRDKTLVQPYGMGHKVNGVWVPTALVTAEGYKLMARNAGVQTFNAPTVVVDGLEQPNPYLIRDDKGQVRQIYCRSISVGYTIMGQKAVSDRTAILDLNLYRIVDLLAKAKRKETAASFKIMPEDVDRPGPMWAKYPLDEATVMWVDTTSDAFAEWMAQMTNRQRKALEICQTFAQRNALKNHPNITTHTVDGASRLAVSILCRLPPKGEAGWDKSAFDVMVKEIASGKLEPQDGNGEPVQVVKGTDAVHEEDTRVIDAEAEAAADEADIHPEPEEGQASGSDEKLNMVITQIKTMASAINPKAFEAICGGQKIDIAGGEAWEMSSPEKLLAIHDACSKALSERQNDEDGRTAKKGGGK